MQKLRLLLLPISLIYGLVVIIRNWCYDVGLFKSTSFNLPVISVGNLDVGGSGKTPMTEYLIRLLKQDHQLATLSRGYGRETKGFRIATVNSAASEVGDEPLQLKRKFPDVNVTVCEDRVAGAERLLADNDVIILDDAFQHRAIKPGFSILLFDYKQIQNFNTFLLPAGNRREPARGRKRADIIVVTKTPREADLGELKHVREKIAPYPHQQLFFAGIQYQPLQLNGTATDMVIDKDTTVFLLTGIANPLLTIHHYLSRYTPRIIHHKYPDHHRFSTKNIAKLADEFAVCTADKKIIVTTEKDMQRLGEQDLQSLVAKLTIYTLPIGVEFLNDEGQHFNQLIQNYVRQYTAHRGLH
ncbi:tetraacyldisaccharide 4'-kinase [Mucilaginibacter myungsuensis]|uniref:Tetraacyldisaccharide 4'-kinase n=1 Tax=Mucilaginibacter myungsuensis TaxID=649104 RepID=A0A929KWM0_9SPHI|nr:tetraacyldisaccharide 4'-kinase [Mucilaginibacter myungsuensis]MBE9661798.1 tetraacyldisaccharide 4'-kinase [Mucilaginibacter myungsuensis]MDN3599768.1 tetraacyldisaccharide 4'-kinase [Mucilaginibacter myungsuensis]